MNTLEDLKKALKAHEAQAFPLNYTIADDPELSGEEYHACQHYVDLCRSLFKGENAALTEAMTALRKKLIEDYLNYVRFIENLLKEISPE